MAKLDTTPYPGNWGFNPGSESLDEYSKRIDKLFADIPDDKVISFPFADGFAMYFVKSMRPLVLQHIPYGDAWQIPYAHIRGLRLADVELMLKRTGPRLKPIFG